MADLSRQQVLRELIAAPISYRELLNAATPAGLSSRTDGTRWTNQEMLFHLLLGYLVVRTLLPLVAVITRLPPPARRGFAAVLNAAARPFHLVNYLGSVLGGHLLTLSRMAALFDRTCAALARRLERSSDADLARRMPFPSRWDLFFTDHMTLLDIYHYPRQHDEFHRRQLTLDRTGPLAS
jgi:DinB superfamily